MKSHHLISIFLVPIFISGCAAVRPVSDMALGAGGGYLANKLSNGNPAITAAGAAGGVLVSEGANYLAGKAADNAYATGYEKGRSDAVKQQYWILIHQQQQQKTLPENISLYAIPIPEQTIDGTILNPTTKYLRIEN
jgi:membrane protein DedA with SNARE-associated domain